MLDYQGEQQPSAASGVSFPAFCAPGWPLSATESVSRPVASHDDADTRLNWPPASVQIAGGETEMPGVLPGLDWLVSPIDAANRQTNGAPAVSMPGLAGRFAAEWCPTSARSDRTALWRVRGKTNGGVMVRRAILDRGDELAADDEALPMSQVPAAIPVQARAHWRGAGGRWLVWVARAIAWAVLILIGYRGVLAIIQGQGTGTQAGQPPSASGTQFPVALAEAYAEQFGTVYLNLSPATAAQRGQELARFLPPGADSQFGWNGAGIQHLESEQVAGISVKGPHTAIVTLLARLGGGRMIELAVPVYAARGGMTVPARPALLPAPGKAAPASGQLASDQATETVLQSQLPAFFQAYASGDRTTLARFAAPGAHIAGLGGAVTFGAIDSVFAPTGGNDRRISVTVTWDLPAAPAGQSGAGISSAPPKLQMTYDLTVVRQAASWDVRSIGASTESLGPP